LRPALHHSEPAEVLEHTLIQRPERSGADERLVVEADREQPLDPSDRGESVVLEARPRILMTDLHPIPHRRYARSHIGSAVDVHQAVGTAPRAAEKPARTMVLEAAGEDPDAGRIELCRHG